MGQLVLTRRPGEQVRIAGSVRVTVVAVSGRVVRLAFEAPLEVAVDREEVHARKVAAGEVAEEMGPSTHAAGA